MPEEETGMLVIDWAFLHVHSHKCIGYGSENGRRWNSFLLHVAQIKSFDSLSGIVFLQSLIAQEMTFILKRFQLFFNIHVKIC